MAGVSLRNISKSYGGKAGMPAVSDMNFEVPDNCFLTLLGPSGCGKTTTLRLIAGFLEPDSGEIRVGDRLVSARGNVTPPERRGMGMVFQNYAIWPHKTVSENVAFGLKLRRVSQQETRERIAQALDMVALGGLADRYPNQLSGGQQQRVALARSLVVRPDILLLDEPLSNLDAKLREHMRGELKRLQRLTGITFIYVTHDQGEALALSDQIAVIHDGQLQQIGSPTDVYMRPAKRLVADFMGQVNIIPGELTAPGKFTSADFSLQGVAYVEQLAGKPVELAVRPENVRIGATSVVSTCQGKVIERVFLGNLCEYQIRLASGRILRTQTHPVERFEMSENVSVTISPDLCSVFQAQPGKTSSS
jgi:iron(III) transport system ATP-binding protein